MIAAHYELTGENELKQKFSALGDNIQRRVMIRALKKCTSPLVAKMKSLAPVSPHGVTGERLQSRNHPSGYLKASIGTIVGKDGKIPTVWVRPRFRGAWDPWYEHFPMAGTKYMTKAPKPFVDEAWAAVGAQVEASLQADLSKNIQEEINRL